MLRRAIALATVGLLGAAANAAATPPPRYASPSGTSAQSCSSPATACDIATAIDGSGGNDPVTGQDVILEPGTYTLGATLQPTVATNIHGVAGQPRPVIKASALVALDPGTTLPLQLSDLEIDTQAEGGNDSINTRGATFDRVVITGDSGGNLCQCYDGTIRNSVIVDTASSGAAWGINSNGGNGVETLRNDTFIATQATAYAMWMLQVGSPSLPTTIDAQNVIALNTSGGHDVYAYGHLAAITMAYSDYSNPLQGSTGVVTDAGHNISAAPAFLDLAGGDYRELASSPTVDAGVDDTTNDGTLDLAGNPRIAGARTDIGAFEYQPPPAAVTASGGTPQSTLVGSAFAQPLSARVTDAQGYAVAGVTVTFTAPSPADATFAGGATTAQATTGANGVATAPALTAGTKSGSYAVSASAAGIATAAGLPLTNLPGAPTSLSLSPSRASIAAGRSQTYSVAAFDAYGNVTGSTGVRLSIVPDGACTGMSCTALVPRAHTVTATLGSLRTSAKLSIRAVAPRLGLTTTALTLGHRSFRATLVASCSVPARQRCSVSGMLRAVVGKRGRKLGTISGRLVSGRRGRLTFVLADDVAGSVRGHIFNATLTITVTSVSGRATKTLHLRIKFK